MQVFEKGRFVIIEGTLFTPSKKGEESPEFLMVQTTKGEKERRFVKFNISVAVGSQKQDDGSYKDIYEYHDFTVWDNGGASTEFIDFVANPPSEGLRFKNKTRVKLYGFVKKTMREYEGKTYYSEEFVDFLHIYKVPGMTKSNGNNTDNSEPITKPDSNSTVVPF